MSEAFNDIKQYLINPLVLTTLVSLKPFLWHIRVMDNALGALFTQTNEKGYEQTIYYLNWMMIGIEHRYIPIE